jgi:RNA polymerase sigma-70 factor (ECF subfamily)
MKNLSDEELVEKVRKEDSELYAEIVERYQQKLYRYLRYLTDRPSEAEDLLQDVFIKTYRNLFDFDGKRKFSSWIYRIAHNEGVNFIKKTSRRKEIFLNNLENIDSALHNQNNAIEDSLAKEEIREKVKQCLDELETKYREPLILYYFEDKSYREISDILRIPAKTVGTFIFRGKRILKAICQKKGGNLIV